MAKKKSRQTYLKRQRELQRMEKADSKRQRRLGRKSGEGPLGYRDVVNPDRGYRDPTTELPEGGSMESPEPAAVAQPSEAGALQESTKLDALRQSIGLGALRKSIRSGAASKSAAPVPLSKSTEPSESEPSPPEVEGS